MNPRATHPKEGMRLFRRKNQRGFLAALLDGGLSIPNGPAVNGVRECALNSLLHILYKGEKKVFGLSMKFPRLAFTSCMISINKCVYVCVLSIYIRWLG